MKTLLLCMLLFPLGMFAQLEMRKSSLAPVGGSVVAGNNYMIHAGGELAHRETDQGNMHLSEGFIGPDFSQILGTEDYQTLEGVRVFPNPVDKDLSVKLPHAGTFELHLFDLNGKEILRQTTRNITCRIDMHTCVPGMYMLVIVNRKDKTFISIKIQKK